MIPTLLALAMAACSCTAGASAPLGDEDGVRAPIPPAEEIAKLPPDGGEEFNRLVFSKSPYLLQHARNPVDWHEWGTEAFGLAKERDVPVFLSIGYSTCHWCHVMEHESFEDQEVAKLMNESFVCIKVDREERPDIDQLYMTVTQSMTGSGGWPMTVVMTPEKKPFFAGTYFPKDQRGQRYGMLQLVPQLSSAWVDRRDEVVKASEQITLRLAEMSRSAPGELLGSKELEAAQSQLAARYDATHGGFGSSRKFPVPHEVRFLFRRHRATGDQAALDMALGTLRAWRLGGVFDHVGLGIHRYSTDREWLVPHFEKMLYDQALCVLAYVEAWQVTRDPEFERAAREILEYVTRDLTSPEGGFYSAEDADSEGEEGLFYLWTVAEIDGVLGEQEAAFVKARFGVTEEGNYRDEATGKRTGRNILHLLAPLDAEERARWEPLRVKLFRDREKRIHPLKDDKVLSDWNGLMIAAFATAGRAFGDEALVAQAARAANFLEAELLTDEGRLLKRWRAGDAGLMGMLEDYAFATMGLLALFEARHDPGDLVLARRMVDVALAHFWDEESGGFFLNPSDGEALIVRAKEVYDGARPSGNSVLATEMLRLARLTGHMEYEERALATIRAFANNARQGPQSFTQLLAAVSFLEGPSREIVIVGEPGSEEMEAVLAMLGSRFAPGDVVIRKSRGTAERLGKVAPFTEAQGPREDAPFTAYVCEDFACKAPVTDLAALRELLSEASKD